MRNVPPGIHTILGNGGSWALVDGPGVVFMMRRASRRTARSPALLSAGRGCSSAFFERAQMLTAPSVAGAPKILLRLEGLIVLASGSWSGRIYSTVQRVTHRRRSPTPCGAPAP